MRRPARVLTSAALVACAAIGLLPACGPQVHYVRPAPVDTAPEYREGIGWKTAQPADSTIRGNWWEVFGEPALNALEEQVAVSNQNIQAAAAQFAQARAAVRAARSALFPQLNTEPAMARARLSGNRAISSFHEPYGDFPLPADASYEADVWGRVRGTVEASRATAQATAADLESVSLSVHSELAFDYFSVRGLDRERELLDSAVDAYQRALELTTNRFNGGLASQLDVAQAEAQLETTRAQAVDLAASRAAFEHAIAVLIGRSASTFSLAAAPLTSQPAAVPLGVPSDMLERRPDIAAAERRILAASAQLAVARTAYYPLLTLSGAAGFESSSIGSWLAGASNFWSVGATALTTVFDAGRRRATAAQARAVYEQEAASYQESVLNAFREVEDQLAALRVLDEEGKIQETAVAASERSLALANNRYRGGVATYLEVISAQSAALANERVAVSILTRQMTASVLLIKALGGGWSASSLPAVSGR